MFDVMPDRETREHIRQERSKIVYAREGDPTTRPGPPFPDPETEGRRAFAAIGQPWPGDVAVAA